MHGIAILVIDMQASILNVVAQAEFMLRRCQFAVAVGQLLEIPVLYTQQAPKQLGLVAKELLEICKPAIPVVSKHTFSAFKAPQILDYLKSKEIKHVLVCGVELSICIYQTVLDCASHGLSCTILSDCVSGRRPEDHPAIWAALQHTAIRHLSSETVFYSLLSSAEHPLFRAFNALVKSYQIERPRL